MICTLLAREMGGRSKVAPAAALGVTATVLVYGVRAAQEVEPAGAVFAHLVPSKGSSPLARASRSSATRAASKSGMARKACLDHLRLERLGMSDLGVGLFWPLFTRGVYI